MLRLSQGQLTVLATCPRRFQYSVLQQLAAPASAEQQARMEWGDRFHLLMQQDRMQLPLDTILEGNQDLGQAFQILHQRAPHLFSDASLSEHLRSFSLGGYSFSVVYDLLVAEPKRGQIIDWKTYPRPQTGQWLEEHWQTKLYCYSLVQTSSYQPQQVSMTYWFVRGSEITRETRQEAEHEAEVAPESLTFAYSGRRHQQIHTELEEITAQLNQWLEGYASGQDLPQVDWAQGICEGCPFLKRCRGSEGQSSELSSVSAVSSVTSLLPEGNTLNPPDLDSIEEISL